MAKAPTQKQIKLIKLVRENIGDKKSTKSMFELCLEAGYTEATAKNAYLIFETEAVQDGISDFLTQLDDKRKMAITHITEKKLKKATARENAYVADILTKNHQLLSGKATERTEDKFNDEQINTIAERLAKKEND